MWSFEASVDVDTGCNCLWGLFADVNGWPAWNTGIEKIELLGPFMEGAEFTMQPPGMEPFTSLLEAVCSGQSFTDITVLNGTTVRVHHGLYVLSERRTRVTYRAEVTGPAEDELGPMVTGDFEDILGALKRLAEQKNRAA